MASLLALAACGDDEGAEDDVAQTSPDGTTPAVSNNGTASSNTGGMSGGSGPTSTGDTATTGGETGTTSPMTTTGSSTMDGRCTTGTVLVLSPSDGDTLTLADDVEPERSGVQIAMRVATDLEADEVLLTVENTTLGFSTGMVSEGAETVVSGVPLANGDNALTVYADREDCYVDRSLRVTLDAGSSCEVDAQCNVGELCEEGGFCQACMSECSEDSDCPGGRCVQGCVCVPVFNYLLLEDTSPTSTGNTPGVDLDAVGLRKPGQEEVFVARVWESNLEGEDNRFNDPAAILGLPDADCVAERFASLGGRGGFVIVGFEADTSMEPGDIIMVYELGPTLCPEQTGWVDEPYQLSVAVSNEEGLFIEIGEGGTGQNMIPVPMLP
ncbi:MAG: hypothetical protein AAFX99_16855 [Myxococcota bacterium]